jgi:hypothetical protein
VFALVIEQLRGLDRPDRDVFPRAYHVLERLALVQSFVLLADFVEDGLMEQLFAVLLGAITCVPVPRDERERGAHGSAGPGTRTRSRSTW